MTDSIPNDQGGNFRFQFPYGEELPVSFSIPPDVYQAPLPPAEASKIAIKISPDSDRLQFLIPFPAWKHERAQDIVALLKVRGKCTTDHISPAGPWYDYRGHLDNISNNLLTGAENAFLPTHPRGTAQHALTSAIDSTAVIARSYREAGVPWCIIAGDNYGEGSSREHAALEPRYLGCTVIVAKSFARIHETNLKKQGVLAATFVDGEVYERIERDDRVSILGVEEMEEAKELRLRVTGKEGSWETRLRHSYSREQILWLKAGSALNHIKASKEDKTGRQS
jgi:aconitate hydratase